MQQNTLIRQVQKQEGFTIIEAAVTIVVTSIFLTVFFQSITSLGYQRMAVAREAAANDIAYTNLRKVVSKSVVASLPCVAGGWDLTTLGYSVEPDNDQVKSLGAGRVQTLRAYPSGDCSTFATDPVRVVSTVRYKVNNSGTENVVVHASYVR